MPLVELVIDPDRQVKSLACDCCETPFDRVTGFINNENGAYAIYFASCYHHDGVHDAWIDVIMDDHWDADAPATRPGAGRVTFGCRVGPVEGHDGVACSLVGAAQLAADIPLYGRKLSRDEALDHPWLVAYWDTVDHILENDPTVSAHLYGV